MDLIAVARTEVTPKNLVTERISRCQKPLISCVLQLFRLVIGALLGVILNHKFFIRVSSFDVL